MRLAFGDCALDGAARALTRAGRQVELSPKALELLLVLVESRPRALSRAEIHDRLWPDSFVSEASLRQLVMELRRALGDDPRKPRFVRTVRRFGYAFDADVREVGAATPPAASRLSPCWLLRGTRELPLYQGGNLLGRDPGAAVRLASEKASRRHALIFVNGGEARLEDLGSRNGTCLNGLRLEDPAKLVSGDRIEVGRELLVFCTSAVGTTLSDVG